MLERLNGCHTNLSSDPLIFVAQEYMRVAQRNFPS